MVFFLKKGLVFATKPVVYLRWDEIQSVELMRGNAAMGSRFFDLRVYAGKQSDRERQNVVVDFQQIDRSEYQGLVLALQDLKVKIKNLQQETKQEGLLGDDLPSEDDDEDDDYSSDDSSAKSGADSSSDAESSSSGDDE